MKKCKTIIFLSFLLMAISCQKNLLWVDDVEQLLTEWTNKSWENRDSGITRTYYWEYPRRFADSDSSWGWWILPISGVLRETHFKGKDTLVTDYKIISIKKDLLIKQRLDDSTAPKITYHVIK